MGLVTEGSPSRRPYAGRGQVSDGRGGFKGLLSGCKNRGVTIEKAINYSRTFF